MEFFFKPRGIALVGATPQAKGGHAILINLMKGYKGAIYPVNPRYPEIEGLTSYPSVADVPDPVELAIVFVPAVLVPDVVSQCVARGIKGIIIESAGFAETGPKGRKLQEDVLAIARAGGVRLWGPNCMGLVDIKAKHVFSFVSPTIWNGMIEGDVSLIVQSGMLSGGFLTDTMTHGTMGVSKVCSIGNKMDVSETDLLEYLLKDPDTKAVALYLESIPDGRRFLDLCRGADKPVVVLKGGKSRRGAEAAMSHTASLAGDGALISGALAQAGVIEAYDFKQMMDVARSLAMHPVLPSDSKGRTAILTYSGGAGIMSADFLERLGLCVADLSPESEAMLAKVYPEWMPVKNPIDLWPAVEKNGPSKVYGTALAAACFDPNVDAILMHLFTGSAALSADYTPMAQMAKAYNKPLFVWLIGENDGAKKAHIELQNLGIPVYRELYRTVECMAAAFSHSRLKAASAVAFPEISTPVLSPTLNEILSTQSGPIDEHLSKKILEECGVRVVAEAVAESAEEAVGLAEKWGFPVVAKGIAQGGVHKTELGLVRLNLNDWGDVERAFKDLSARVGQEGLVLMQKQVPPGLELIVGLFRDPQFGPSVMVGLGGVYAEVLADKVFAVGPVTESEALAMLSGLKNQKLLDGFRGAKPLNREATARIIASVSRLGASFPRIMEIDINPLIVADGEPVAVDATIVLG